MASSILRPILNRVAQTAVQFGVKRGLEAATGEDFRSIGEVLNEILERELNIPPADASSEDVQEAAQRAFQDGRINRQQLMRAELQVMTDFNSFMSIGLNQCGSDRETFAGLVEVWNREKEEIRQMSQAEVRQQLRCP